MAQVVPPGNGSSISFSAGAGFSAINTDYATHPMYGITAFADATFRDRYGIELEGRTTQFDKFANQYGSLREDTIAAGGRYVFLHGKYKPYAKALAGIGSIDFIDQANPNYHHDTFTIYEIGGGLDYKLRAEIWLRAQYDYQRWPGWLPHGLTPSGATVGAYWRFR